MPWPMSAAGPKPVRSTLESFNQPKLNLDLQKLAGLEGDRIHIHGLVAYGPMTFLSYLLRFMEPVRGSRARRNGSAAV